MVLWDARAHRSLWRDQHAAHPGSPQERLSLIALARGRPWGVVDSRGAAPAAASLYAQRARAAISSELGSDPHGGAFP